MTTPTKPSSAPTKARAVKSKTAPRKPPVKSAQPKAKPPVAVKVAAKSIATKPVTTATAVLAKALASAVKTTVSAPESKALKALKPKKIKLVRDSFTIPKSEYLVLDDLKLRAAELKHPVKKGELLRAGIKALAAMTTTQFHSALQAVPALKTGRPRK